MSRREEDLERLQEEFFAGNQVPSAKVIRQSAPTVTNKKRSLFAERLAQNKTATMAAIETMPALEPALDTMPALEPALETMPALDRSSETTPHSVSMEEEVEYEPVMDPHPEPHVPVTKKMIDLTSLLGQVLGDIKEHTSDHAVPPSLPVTSEGKPARGQHNGFPTPVHRSEFKKRLAKQKEEKKVRVETPPRVEQSNDENEQRIRSMSAEEIQQAREEIMECLSKESIEFLMKGRKKGGVEKTVERQEDEELAIMKSTYFPEVPLEEDKLAWILNKEVPVEPEKITNELERMYRLVRFDLQGQRIDPAQDIPRHKGLHHHGDDPDKAGYSLAELFLLSRSQMPSQRAMVLNVIARIIQHNKELRPVFLDTQIAATVYLRSALDDRHLVVQVAAIHALSALVTTPVDLESQVLDVDSFNQFLGHVVLKKSSKERVRRKGLNEKLSEFVESGSKDYTDDVHLVERDLVRGLIQMDLLPRFRYLVDPKSELLNDRASVELVVGMLLEMAKEGQDVCEAIADEELVDPLVYWGIENQDWPMLDQAGDYPCLGVVRLLSVLSQGSKRVAETLVEKARITLQFLVTSPEISSLKRHAYALQIETLKLLRILAAYGLIVPTLIKDIHSTLLDWLFELSSSSDELRLKRASTALSLLEVLLSAAADPHKTIPEHAIDWNEASAYVPAVIAIMKEPQSDRVYDTALAYLGTWASHHNLFPPSPELAEEARKAVTSMNIRHTTHSVMRYIQFITAYRHQDSSKLLGSKKDLLKKDIFGRYGLWIALRDWVPEREDVLTCGILGNNIMERWLSKCYLQTWMKQEAVGELAPFYLDKVQDDVISKALFHYDGRPLTTFVYETAVVEQEVTQFILSPIDAMYHFDKSDVAQCYPDKICTLVHHTLQLASSIQIDHDAMIIGLMKIFLIGDREGQNRLMNEREIFWNVSDDMDMWLDRVCKTKTDLNGLETAWMHSSEYIQENQVPFYQFYQGFVSQYASISFGHHGFARLLLYLVTQIDIIDYRHLVFSDYRDIVPTLKVSRQELPPLSTEVDNLLKQVGISLL